MDRVVVAEGTYRDSVSLMLASQAASRIEGVESVSAVSATPMNLELLARSGFRAPSPDEATPADLVIAVRAADGDTIERAVSAIRSALKGGEGGDGGEIRERAPRSLAAAARRRDANLAVVSVPGDRAAYECATALEAGLNVFCFSSGFAVQIEAALKRRALQLRLLMMGPDCGTAIIDGTGIGFANEVERGPVGIVAASGTGAQQLCCLLDSAGVGVSQLIGVGGRDLRAEVDGTMSARAISLLGEDPGTECIVVVGKSPDPGVSAALAQHAADAGKPTILGLPGAPPIQAPPTVETAGSLEDAAVRAARTVGAELAPPEETPAPVPARGAVRGLFCGGTLRDEALGVFAAQAPASRVPLALDHVDGSLDGRDAFIDFGSEALTSGRPHPMIDPGLRDGEVIRQAHDQRVGVILVDVVLGRCAHPDPAAGLMPAIERALASRDTGELAVVVSLCGAERDPQGLARQAEALRRAGATVARSNAHAAHLAVRAVGADTAASKAAGR